MSSPCHCSSLRAAGRRLSARYDAALAPLGLNVAQFALLRRLARLGAANLTALARALQLERSTVGRNARVLERLGLIAAGRAAEDRREALLRLTPHGEARLAEGVPLWEGCQEALEARLGPDRVALLEDVLALL